MGKDALRIIVPDSDKISELALTAVVESDDSSNGAPKPMVITPDILLAAEESDIEEVMRLLTVKDHHARHVLTHYKWNLCKISSLVTRKGRNHLFQEAGLSSATVTCSKCSKSVDDHSISTMGCGHSFCNDCWTDYLVKKIQDGKSKIIRCMEEDCSAMCNETTVRNLVGAKNTDLVEQFNRSLLASYIEGNSRVKMCPRKNPYCGNAIRIDDDAVCEVECSCGFRFCFRCLEQPHSPCSCEVWKLWTERCKEAELGMNFGKTKPCPKCSNPIERTGGCNFVNCPDSNCHQPFCWICGEATGKDHTDEEIYNHTCGRYKPDDQEAQDLHRFRHYHKLYTYHFDSFEKEKELKQELMERISSSKQQLLYVDPGWLERGFNSLSVGRWAIIHSYPFAFYMYGDVMEKWPTPEERDIHQQSFQVWQSQLEINVEKLSAAINELSIPVDEESVHSIIDLSASMHLACFTMYDSVEEIDGYKNSRSITKAEPFPPETHPMPQVEAPAED